MALPENPPIPAATIGLRLRMSILIPSMVLMRVSPSAPASSQARAISTMSVTLGLSLMNTGLRQTAFTAAVTSAAAEAQVPKAIPPLCTLGQETLTSMMSIPSHASALAQFREYSSTENPLMLAITVLWYIFLSAGTFSSTRTSIPGFCRPTELIIPPSHSAMRGVGLPKRASPVVPLRLMPPRMSRSNASAISSPKPNVPLAGITGLSSRSPQRLTERSLTILCPPS